MIPFINIETGNTLTQAGSALVDSRTNAKVADVVDDIPRFVRSDEYAESFGWQWQRWHSTLSDSRGEKTAGNKRSLILRRTRFDTLELEGKTILECGMGGGDDTEILLSLPFAEVHAFDLSQAVNRAGKYLQSDRLRLSQASIFSIPYADRSFDFVFCHRVIQHTPDPRAALKAIAQKVKPGGVLFVHSYNRSRHFMSQYKYKYRPLTKRLPKTWLASALDTCGPTLHKLNRTLRAKAGPVGRAISTRFVPFEHLSSLGAHDDTSIIEVEKLCTFDALTPTFDDPMTWATMRGIVESLGFEILYYQAEPTYPLYCTAKRTG